MTIPKVDNKTIIENWNAGMKVREIAKLHGMNWQTVGMRISSLRKRGVDVEGRTKRTGKKPMVLHPKQPLFMKNPENVKIIRMMDEGYTYLEIATHLGTAPANIGNRVAYLRMKGINITPRQMGRSKVTTSNLQARGERRQRIDL